MTVLETIATIATLIATITIAIVFLAIA